jgi:hypothetical protein
MIYRIFPLHYIVILIGSFGWDRCWLKYTKHFIEENYPIAFSAFSVRLFSNFPEDPFRMTKVGIEISIKSVRTTSGKSLNPVNPDSDKKTIRKIPEIQENPSSGKTKKSNIEYLISNI